jgi:hypothetical protein
MKRRFMGVHTMNYHPPWHGSQAISGGIMCIICPVASPSIVSRRSCAIIRSSRASVGSRFFKACDARLLLCGMRNRNGSYHFGRLHHSSRKRRPERSAASLLGEARISKPDHVEIEPQPTAIDRIFQCRFVVSLPAHILSQEFDSDLPGP